MKKTATLLACTLAIGMLAAGCDRNRSQASTDGSMGVVGEKSSSCETQKSCCKSTCSTKTEGEQN